MNEFLQNNLIAIIIFLLLIILLLIGLIGFVLLKLLLQKNSEGNVIPQAPEKPPFAQPTLKPVSKYKEEPVAEKFFCHNHPDAQSAGGCLICEDVFCDTCLVEHEGLYFCREHFRIFANNKWKQITDVKTTPDTPVDGLYVYHFKRKKWKEAGIPGYILTHYKINIEDDFIESFVQLYVIEKDAEKLEKEIENYRAEN